MQRCKGASTSLGRCDEKIFEAASAVDVPAPVELHEGERVLALQLCLNEERGTTHMAWHASGDH